MKSIIIIPARMGSSRFPGKPMEEILGVPMIGHCYHRASLAENFDLVAVATCDKVIFDYIESIGGKAVMTSDKHDRATDRTAEALQKIEDELDTIFDVVVMLQGDEPTVIPDTISRLKAPLEQDGIPIANIIAPFESEAAFADVNNVKVVFGNDGNALYFSREMIPSPWKSQEGLPRFMQVGIIGFQRDALNWFQSVPQTPLEQIESVDMNRVLEYGKQIKLVNNPFPMLGVDTPEELKIVEKQMRSDCVSELYVDIEKS